MADHRAIIDDLVDRLLAKYGPGDDVSFWGAQFDMGLAWIHFPVGLGGLGMSSGSQVYVDERLTSAPRVNRVKNVIGLGMAAPTILAHGTPSQQHRWLRPLYTAEEIWCQLFSEPGAGSDLAGLATRAVRDGDQWVVNGQKVWTSLAHHARWGLLLARTDPNIPKHQGLTYFMLDMRQPGVEVRPLRQMTGEADFNEVYLTDAQIPDEDRVGEVGDGWRVALTTLMHERVAIGSEQVERSGGLIGETVRRWQSLADPPRYRRDELIRLWIEAEVCRLTNLRAGQRRRRGTPGPEGSTAKLAWAELNKRVTDLLVELEGPAGMLYPGGYENPERHSAGRTFLRARANSIEGGTSEVLRNILGERVLGLPGERRVDKDIPWKEITVA